MLIDELLKMDKEQLENLDIPVKYITSIGIPIARVVNDLQRCIDALIDDRTKHSNEEQVNEGVEEVIEDAADSGAVSSDNS